MAAAQVRQLEPQGADFTQQQGFAVSLTGLGDGDRVGDLVEHFEALDEGEGVTKPPEAEARRTAHHVPVFAMDAQGSAGGLGEPSCSSSMEIPSGDLTKAMFPSRGGRLITTPAACRRAQVS